MNYQKIYDDLISRAKARESIEGYTEKHHIVPKCMGGTDDKENIAVLTAREHYVAHLLLVKIYPEKLGLIFALHRMTQSNGTRRGLTRSRLYGKLRELHSEATSKYMANHWKSFAAKNHREQIIKSNTTRNTDGIGEKISKSLKAYYVLNPVSEEAKLKNSKAQLKRFKECPQTIETRELRKLTCRATSGTPVICWKNNSVVGIYESAAEAAEALVLANSQPIYTCCKRRELKDYPYSVYGYVWTYTTCNIRKI